MDSPQRICNNTLKTVKIDDFNETYLTIFYTVIATITTLWAIIGNILVITSVSIYAKLQSLQNYYIVSLALADLIISVFVFPLYIVNIVMDYWPFGKIMCNVWMTSEITACTVSVWNLASIALDRYNAIADPLHYAQTQTMKRFSCITACVWILPLVLAIFVMTSLTNGWTMSMYDENIKTCKTPGDIILTSVGIILLVVMFLLPFISMCVMYGRIYVIARRHIRKHYKKWMPVLNKQQKEYKQEEKKEISDSLLKKEQGDNSESNEKSRTRPKLVSQSSQISFTRDGFEITTEYLRSISKEDPNNSLSNSLNQLNNITSTEKTSFTNNESQEKNIGNSYDQAKNGKNKKKSRFHQQPVRCICHRKEKRVLYMMLTVLGVFFICWLPVSLFHLCAQLLRYNSMDDSFHRVEHFTAWMGYSNSAFNPIIYTIFNPDFRNAFKKILTFQACCHCRQILKS